MIHLSMPPLVSNPPHLNWIFHNPKQRDPICNVKSGLALLLRAFAHLQKLLAVLQRRISICGSSLQHCEVLLQIVYSFLHRCDALLQIVYSFSHCCDALPQIVYSFSHCCDMLPQLYIPSRTGATRFRDCIFLPAPVQRVFIAEN